MIKIGRGDLGAAAAKLYREFGEEEKCAEYFENHLGKEEEPYDILIDYYKDRNHEKAVEIIRLFGTALPIFRQGKKRVQPHHA
ncbi:hypothetical protein, partial [Acetatifactor muris]|uniref:hypothetical protein n=1 Tax=Acetatifactor muris TaxID=879566 RepID=UPI0023F26FC9